MTVPQDLLAHGRMHRDDAMPPNRRVLAGAKRAQQAYDLNPRGCRDGQVSCGSAREGLYGAGASAEMTRLELAAGKAWQRCCILGATRADQDAAREASR